MRPAPPRSVMRYEARAQPPRRVSRSFLRTKLEAGGFLARIVHSPGPLDIERVIYKRERMRHTANLEPRFSQQVTMDFISRVGHHARKWLLHQSETLRRLRPAQEVPAIPAEGRKVEFLRKRHQAFTHPLAAPGRELFVRLARNSVSKPNGRRVGGEVGKV
jgi:hypothetical protein